MYEVTISHVEEMEWKASSYIRRWLGVPRSLLNIAFYGHNTKLQLPLSSLIEEFKVTKARLYMMLRDLEDQVIRDTLPEVKTGMKWSAREEVEATESCLWHKDIGGATQSERAGLGMQKQTDEIRASQEEACQTKAADLVQQGTWTRWKP